MKKLIAYPLAILLSVSAVSPSIADSLKANAPESKRQLQDTDHHRDREDFREAKQIHALREEIQELRKDVARLEKLLLRMATDRHQPPAHIENRWACYVNDHRVGGIYAAAQTEYEALGKTLEKCKEKGGHCREREVKCQQSVN